MSLIERALGKAKDANRPRATPYAQRPVLGTPPQRVASQPQLHITPEMMDQLGLSAPQEQQHQRASEYRHVKRRLLAGLGAEARSRVILVASALAGEGKSFTSANLARSLALEPDFSVLLIDADAVKPALSRGLQIQERPGLMNALVDPTLDVESLVMSTDIEGLSVLPAGGAHENATEYFASDRMHQLLDRLLEMPNRIIVVDSLPLLLTTEARVLAPLAGQVVLVVRAETTPQAAVEQAVNLLGDGVEIGLLLNAVVRTKVSRYLGYGYGFDYEYT